MLDAVKAEPGEHKASGTGQGGIWHLALAGMLAEAGIDPDAAPWVPSQGAAPGLQDLVAGGVDIVTCSVPEAQALLEAGRVKSLAVMSAERNPAFPDVPTLKEATGLDWTIGAWRGIAGPDGHAAGGGRRPRAGAQGDPRQPGVPRLHGAARLRRGVARSGGLPRVHGGERRERSAA